MLKYFYHYFRLKKTKEYKKSGKTWQEICDAAGEPRRTIEVKLKDIQSLVDNVKADFTSFTKLLFYKIRCLEKLVTADFDSFDFAFSHIDECNLCKFIYFIPQYILL